MAQRNAQDAALERARTDRERAGRRSRRRAARGAAAATPRRAAMREPRGAWRRRRKRSRSLQRVATAGRERSLCALKRASSRRREGLTSRCVPLLLLAEARHTSARPQLVSARAVPGPAASAGARARASPAACARAGARRGRAARNGSQRRAAAAAGGGGGGGGVRAVVRQVDEKCASAAQAWPA